MLWRMLTTITGQLSVSARFLQFIEFEAAGLAASRRDPKGRKVSESNFLSNQEIIKRCRSDANRQMAHVPSLKGVAIIGWNADLPGYSNRKPRRRG